jgi:t-SNARE complex subunit (syntaxin)
MQISFTQLNENDELERRTIRIMELEHDVFLVKELFNDLNSLIEEQQEPINVIVAQIESTSDHAKVANDEVELAERYSGQATSKKWALIVFIGAAIILIVKAI